MSTGERTNLDSRYWGKSFRIEGWRAVEGWELVGGDVGGLGVRSGKRWLS